MALIKGIILAQIFVLFGAVFADFSTAESHLYLDFSTRNARGWEGLDAWKWVYAPKGMGLKGVAEPEDGQQVLTLNSDRDSAGIITSPELKVSPFFTSCLYVNYYVRVPNHKDYGLTINTVSTTGAVKQVFGISRQDWDVWETAAIPVETNQKLKLQFVANQSSEGIIAFNGFFLREGACKDLSHLNCDFESEGFCHWTTMDHIARVKSGNQQVFKAKPEDHTTDSLFGHTALFAAQKYYNASLISPVIRQSYTKCFSFSFMRNHDGISVSLFESQADGSWRELWHPPGISHSLDEWHTIQVPVEITRELRYKLEITNHQGKEYAALQLDDLKLKPYCFEDLQANFQYGFTAEWHSPKVQPARWQVGKGRRMGSNDFFPPHPVALYTDFTTLSGQQTARLLSDYVGKVNVPKCLKFDFIVENFGENDKFTMDIVSRDGKRTSLWEFDRKQDDQTVYRAGRKVAIPAQFDYYRVEFVATSEGNPKMSAAIMKVDIELAPFTSGECSAPKAKPTLPPPTTAPARKSNISPSVRGLVSVMLKNLRSEVQNILNVVADRKDVLYELVGDVESGY